MHNLQWLPNENYKIKKIITTSGDWELIQIVKGEKFTKLHFKQCEELVYYVMFSDSLNMANCTGHSNYKLTGWQK